MDREWDGQQGMLQHAAGCDGVRTQPVKEVAPMCSMWQAHLSYQTDQPPNPKHAAFWQLICPDDDACHAKPAMHLAHNC
jgi:hypothetical protein